MVFFDSNAEREALLPAFIDTWSAVEPRAALDWLEALTEPEKSRQVLRVQWSLTQNVGPHEPDRVLALVESARPASTTESFTFSTNVTTPLGGLFAALVEKGPAAAAARALALPSGGQRSDAAAGVATAWARRDPAAARAWAESITDAQLAARVMSACAMGMAATDPHGAADWVAEMPATALNRKAMEFIIREWSDADPRGTLAWLDGIGDESVQSDFLGLTLAALAKSDPELAMATAMDWLQQGDGNGRLSDTSWLGSQYARTKGPQSARKAAAAIPDFEQNWNFRSLFQSLLGGAFASDRAGTLDWVAALPPGERRNAAYTEVADQMLSGGAETTAADWVLGLPVHIDSDDARLSTADRIFNRDPDLAVRVISGVSDREAAHRALITSANYALRGAPEKWLPWIEQSSEFSPDEKVQYRAAAARWKK